MTTQGNQGVAEPRPLGVPLVADEIIESGVKEIHEYSHEPIFDTVSCDVIICVHNALPYVKECLSSVLQYTPNIVRLIIVDDGSDPETTDYLAAFDAGAIPRTLIRNDSARGYTFAANQGMRLSDADYVILLNSDTVVTNCWLEEMLTATVRDGLGIAGPISNAATWQSVPDVSNSSGWAVNPAPDGLDHEHMAQLAYVFGGARTVQVPLVNGFCLLIGRWVIETIGYFDEENFGRGYGEENDYCLRAWEAGIPMGIVLSAYVHHANSRSFDPDKTPELRKSAGLALKQKHGAEKVGAAVAVVRDDPELAALRDGFRRFMQFWEDLQGGSSPARPNVLFVLPAFRLVGGVHSIVQAVIGMRRLGIAARIAVRSDDYQSYCNAYTFEFEHEDYLQPFSTPVELQALGDGSDCIIATIWSTAYTINEMFGGAPDKLLGYYVQDYECYFYAAGHPAIKRATRSYDELPEDAVIVAKTNYLRRILAHEHGRRTVKVKASVDAQIFQDVNAKYTPAAPIKIAAMVRFAASMRRAPRRTIRVLAHLKQVLGDQVDIEVFGTPVDEIPPEFRSDPQVMRHHGVIHREEVAAILRRSHIFIDMSDFQALGLTALEAMKCGCAVIVPQTGGTSEYLIPGVNGLAVNSRSEDACFDALLSLCSDPAGLSKMRDMARQTTQHYDLESAATSEVVAIVAALIKSGRMGKTCLERRVSNP